MTHIEDSIIYNGYKSAASAITALEEIAKPFSNDDQHSLRASVKWDGAPAVFFGYLPFGNNEFFVATKGLFGKTRAKYFTSATMIDLDDKVSAGLADKLKVALEVLPKVTPNTKAGTIYQGDILYTPSSLKYSKDKASGRDFIEFHPNTIAYKRRCAI